MIMTRTTRNIVERWGRTCYKCQKLNHLSKCCKSRKAVAQNIEDIEENSQSDSEGYESFAISPKEKTKSARLSVENVEISMIIDSGSIINNYYR